MKVFSAAVLLVVLAFSAPGGPRAADLPPGIAPAPIQSLPPDLERLFSPVERELKKGKVAGGDPVVWQVQIPVPTPPPPPNLCAGQEQLSCIGAYRIQGPIDVKMTNDFRDFMQRATRSGVRKMVIEITTNGGEIPAGHEIARDIENFPGTVVCVIDHHVASMGVYLTQSCDRRVMTKRASLMFHQVLTPVEKGVYNASALRQKISNLDTLNRGYAEQVVARSTVKVDDYLRRTRGREWYLNWDAALRYGFVDVATTLNPNQIYLALRRGEVF